MKANRLFKQFFLALQKTSWNDAFSLTLTQLKVVSTVVENHPKCLISNWTISGIFNELLSTQNVNVASLAKNETFSVIFKHHVVLPKGVGRIVKFDEGMSFDNFGFSIGHMPSTKANSIDVEKEFGQGIFTLGSI